MDDEITRLFTPFDRSAIDRRRLLQALGLAAVAMPLRAFGQGSCGGQNKGTPKCDTTLWKAPFAATGWKTTMLDHFTMQAVDYQKEAAYYQALMGWEVLSDDGKQATLAIGDWGAVIIRGGLVVPPPAPAPTPPAGGDSAAGGGRGGRGGRGGGGGGGGGRARAVWDSFCWGIAPWDTKKVEKALTERGLNPVADHDGKDFQSFHVKDPDGFSLQISNGNKNNKRRRPSKTKFDVPAPFESTGWKTVWLDHLSFGVSNYKETTAFYEALIGWQGTGDEGSQNEVRIGDIGNALVRGANPNDPARGGTNGTTGATAGRAGEAAPRRASLGHISFGITPFDPDAVAADLAKRNLTARVDTGGHGDIHTWGYKSYHTTTPNGFDLQISNINKATREVR